MKIGIIFTWPWGVKNAESEVIIRIKTACKNLNIALICITKDGFIVDNTFNQTKEKINENELSFIINMHYEDIKLLDCFTYHALWNPPKITLQYDNYSLYMHNILTNDDYLVYDTEGEMFIHLLTLLHNENRFLNSPSFLSASFSKKDILPPSLLINPKLFYCGTNWEVFIDNKRRHTQLFDLLDTQDWIKIFGPNRKENHPWKGFRRYCGEIPFDGTSLLKEINNCGVCLVLSSVFHWEGGAISSRLYEACAGGAVIISDDNSFIRKHFGNSILYIDFAPNSPEKMFEQIRQHMEWISVHPQEAIQLAKKSQTIFEKTFTLENQLKKIIDNHKNRISAATKNFYAFDHQNNVASVIFCDFPEYTDEVKNYLVEIINANIKQKFIKINIYILCHEDYTENIKREFSENRNIFLIPHKIYDINKNRVITRGEMLQKSFRKMHGEFLYINDNHFILYSDFITSMVRKLQDIPDSDLVLSQCFIENEYCSRKFNFSWSKEKIESNLFGIDYRCNVLFRKNIFYSIPENSLNFIDGLEVPFITLVSIFNNRHKYCYLNRIVSGIKTTPCNLPAFKFDKNMQLRYMQNCLLSKYKLVISDLVNKKSNIVGQELRNQLLNNIKFNEKKIKKYKFLMKYFSFFINESKYKEKINIRQLNIQRLQKELN